LRLLRPRVRLERASSRRSLTGPPRFLPYLVLLRVGFALPRTLLCGRCALTAPFHPYPGGRFSEGSATACACFAPASGSGEPALAVRSPGRYVFCGTFRRTCLSTPSRTLSGTLLCGVRTFLPLSVRPGVTPQRSRQDGDHPVQHQLFHYRMVYRVVA